MKAWEVLKAIDEGKAVQRCVLTTGNDKTWADVNPQDVKNWLVYCVDLYPVRIKPEPRKVWIVEAGGEGGHAWAYACQPHGALSSLNKVHGPFELKD